MRIAPANDKPAAIAARGEFALASAAEKGYQMSALRPVPALVGL
jgi:hypothetical protein